jgi:hypothetical protein
MAGIVVEDAAVRRGIACTIIQDQIWTSCSPPIPALEVRTDTVASVSAHLRNARRSWLICRVPGPGARSTMEPPLRPVGRFAVKLPIRPLHAGRLAEAANFNVGRSPTDEQHVRAEISPHSFHEAGYTMTTDWGYYSMDDSRTLSIEFDEVAQGLLLLKAVSNSFGCGPCDYTERGTSRADCVRRSCKRGSLT